VSARGRRGAGADRGESASFDSGASPPADASPMLRRPRVSRERGNLSSFPPPRVWRKRKIHRNIHPRGTGTRREITFGWALSSSPVALRGSPTVSPSLPPSISFDLSPPVAVPRLLPTFPPHSFTLSFSLVDACAPLHSASLAYEA